MNRANKNRELLTVITNFLTLVWTRKQGSREQLDRFQTSKTTSNKITS